MSIKTFEHFFKPEARNSGKTLLAKNKVSASQLSDTEIQCYVRASTSFKVLLKLGSVSSPTIQTSCNCPQSKKGQFCKHLWATLLVVEKDFPDFLEDKTDIEKILTSEKSDHPKSRTSQSQIDYKKAFAEKQKVYQKEQYQRQKERLKAFKKSKKIQPEVEQFPPAVERALHFFLENGFPLRESFDKVSINLAKKKLARIFHPDVGGSHQEIVELNQNTEVLINFAKS